MSSTSTNNSPTNSTPTNSTPTNSTIISSFELSYLVLATTFAALLLLTNIIGAKLFLIAGYTMTAGLITYPLTFLITDVTSEVYGPKRARIIVLIGFAMSLLMLLIVQLSIALPPAPGWSSNLVPAFANGTAMQSVWLATFGIGWWLVTGSMLAYMLAQLCDVTLFHWIKKLTNGKYLWLRNNGSTAISQLVDTFTVNSFLFYGAFGWSFIEGIKVMAIIYLFKIAIAIIDTPLCYLCVRQLKKYIET